jgi:hypothetical protein
MFRRFMSVRGAATFTLLCAFPWFSTPSSFAANHLTPGAAVQAPAAEPGQPAASPQTSRGGLHILILSGNNAANVIDTPAAKPLVEVRDGKNAPVEGAMVTFSSPSDGPGVIFSNGLRETTVMTDAVGQATVPSVTAVNAGAFQYHITATYQGQEVTAAMSEINYPTQAEAANSGTPAGAAAKKHSNKMVWFIVGGVAVAAGVGAAAFHASSSGGSTGSIGSGSGTPTVGAPH